MHFRSFCDISPTHFRCQLMHRLPSHLPIHNNNKFDKQDTLESFNEWGGGGNSTIPSPGMSQEQPLPGIGLHDPFHDRQACPEFNSFYQEIA